MIEPFEASQLGCTATTLVITGSLFSRKSAEAEPMQPLTSVTVYIIVFDCAISCEGSNWLPFTTVPEKVPPVGANPSKVKIGSDSQTSEIVGVKVTTGRSYTVTSSVAISTQPFVVV